MPNHHNTSVSEEAQACGVHKWAIKELTTSGVVFVRCLKCELSVEIYPTHVSLWEYNRETTFVDLMPFVKDERSLS